MSGVPILVLREGSEDKREREARYQNINAMIAISEAVRSTMGPKGMSKMMVDQLGDTVITNDGAEILNQLDIENVAANMMVNVAKSIDDDIGDGTTSVVVFSAALLNNALELTEQGVHPSNLTRGYKMAATKAIEVLNRISEKISDNDDEILKNVAKTAMNSKYVSNLKDFFSELGLKAVRQVSGEGKVFDKVDNIKIIKAAGKSLSESELINGVYIQKEKLDPMMPDQIKDARIAVIRKKLDVGKTEFDSQIQINAPGDIQKFLDQENSMLKKYLDVFKKLNVNVIVNNQDISAKFAASLAREGIIAIKNLGDTDIKAVLNALDAKRVDDIVNLSEEDLGHADLVKFERINRDQYLIFSGCENPKSVAILLKGGLENVLGTAEEGLHDVLSVIAKTIDTKEVVGGGGAVYLELAKQLRAYSNEVSGKEQLAITAFALALEEIPLTLIENSGLDVVEKMTKLRASHKTEENKWIGIDTISNKICNTFEAGIIEPTALLRHLIKEGNEIANLILRIDRIISSKGTKLPGMPGE